MSRCHVLNNDTTKRPCAHPSSTNTSTACSAHDTTPLHTRPINCQTPAPSPFRPVIPLRAASETGNCITLPPHPSTTPPSRPDRRRTTHPTCIDARDASVCRAKSAAEALLVISGSSGFCVILGSNGWIRKANAGRGAFLRLSKVAQNRACSGSAAGGREGGEKGRSIVVMGADGGGWQLREQRGRVCQDEGVVGIGVLDNIFVLSFSPANYVHHPSTCLRRKSIPQINLTRLNRIVERTHGIEVHVAPLP